MKFQGQIKRKRKGRKRKLLPLLFIAILLAIFYSLYHINKELTPIYAEYAEVQTQKIASHVISEAITTRITNVLDVNDIIEHVPSETSNMVTTKFNTEIINRVLADTRTLAEKHLEQAQEGNLNMLPMSENIEYDPLKMEEQGGIVFFVPLGQATNIPLLGNLGPKIPIRFHVIGDVLADVETKIEDFGINNAYVEVNVILTVNVQIIVPFSTKTSIVQQTIPVAMGLVQSPVPNIYSSGQGGMAPPSIQVPIKDIQDSP